MRPALALQVLEALKCYATPPEQFSFGRRFGVQAWARLEKMKQRLAQTVAGGGLELRLEPDKWKTMKTKKTLKLSVAILMLAPAMYAPRLEHSRSALLAQDVEPIDAQGKALITKFVAALQTGDEEARVQACLPFLHRSLLTPEGTDIDPSVKKVAWKKAGANAAGLEAPVKIERVRSRGNLTIGEGSRKVEPGRVDDYFLARHDKNALPARVTIFFPEKGEPKVYDLSGI